jgi:hypothetical protein
MKERAEQEAEAHHHKGTSVGNGSSTSKAQFVSSFLLEKRD